MAQNIRPFQVQSLGIVMLPVPWFNSLPLAIPCPLPRYIFPLNLDAIWKLYPSIQYPKVTKLGYWQFLSICHFMSVHFTQTWETGLRSPPVPHGSGLDNRCAPHRPARTRSWRRRPWASRGQATQGVVGGGSLRCLLSYHRNDIMWV